MGFRQPFTVHTDPANPGIIGMGEYCHDNSRQRRRPRAGRHLRVEPDQQAGQLRLAVLRGRQLAGQHDVPLELRHATTTTGQQYDCSPATIPSDIRYAPAGQTPVEPTFDGLDTAPQARSPATIWKKYPGAADGQSTADFGDLSAGGMQPITGPIYRYDAATRAAGAFPRYYDGAWLINNRGCQRRLLEGSPAPQGQQPDAARQRLAPVQLAAPRRRAQLRPGHRHAVRSRRRAVHVPLLGRLLPREHQRGRPDADREDLVQRPGRVPDRHGRPERHARGHRPGVPGRGRTRTSTRPRCKLTATDSGCAGIKSIEYREQGSTDWLPYTAAVTFTDGKKYTIEYRATDNKDNVSAVKTATFKILEINDTTAPTATAAAAGNEDQRDYFIGSATLTLTATDDATGSGVDKIEYRVNGGAYTLYTAPVAFNTPGTYDVDYKRDRQDRQRLGGQDDLVPHPLGRRLHRRPARTSSTAPPSVRSGSVTRATAARR